MFWKITFADLNTYVPGSLGGGGGCSLSSPSVGLFPPSAAAAAADVMRAQWCHNYFDNLTYHQILSVRPLQQLLDQPWKISAHCSESNAKVETPISEKYSNAFNQCIRCVTLANIASLCLVNCTVCWSFSSSLPRCIDSCVFTCTIAPADNIYSQTNDTNQITLVLLHQWGKPVQRVKRLVLI